MPHSSSRPRGRPKSDNPLTPAQKQAAYRQRVNQRLVADRAGNDFLVKFVRRIDFQMADLLVKYEKSNYMDDKACLWARYSELKELRHFLLGHDFVLDSQKKEKIYKQDELF